MTNPSAAKTTSRPANLIIRPERLGDLVLATPTFRAFKETFPDERLVVLTDDLFGEAIRFDPFVDEIIAVPWRSRRRRERPTWPSITRLLRRGHYRRALLLYPGCEMWNLALAAAGIRRVAQLGGSKVGLLLGHKMLLREWHRERKHYVDWFLGAAALLGAKSSDRRPGLYVRETEIEQLRARFPEFSSGEGRIIVHPFPAGSAPNVGIQSYRDWVVKIAERLGLRIYIVGSAENVRQWRPVNHPRISEELLGSLSIRELLSACHLADVVVAGSTGVIHAAAALGTPTLGFYCPSPGANPDLWGPIGPHSICLTPPPNFCQHVQPNSGACLGTRDCDLALGLDLDSAADSIRKLQQISKKNPKQEKASKEH